MLPLLQRPEEAKKLLFIVKDVLDELKIEFFLLQGTLLGAVRDNGFAPGDEDIDLGAQIYDLAPKIQKLSRCFQVKEIRARLYDAPYKFNKNMKVGKWGVNIDIVSFDFNNGKMFRLGGRYLDKAKVYDRKFADNLKEIDFLGRKFKIFVDAEEWLEIEYGPNWRKKEHRSGKFTTAWIGNYWKDYVLKNKGSSYGQKLEDVMKYKNKT